MTQLFQLVLDSSFIPDTWKEPTIIPVPQNSKAKVPNSYRPTVLTSVLCKCMEHVVCDQLSTSVADKPNPPQFAYKAERGVEDACLTLLDTVAKDLDCTHSCTWVLFMFVSSALNTVNMHTLLDRLSGLQVKPILVLWIRNFLQDRP